MLISNDEYPVATQNVPYEVVLLGNSGAELGDGIDGRVDFPPQGFLGATERFNHLRKANIANNEQIHITAVVLLTPGNRAVDQGNADTVGNGCQGTLQGLSNAGGFGYQAFQFREDRRC